MKKLGLLMIAGMLILSFAGDAFAQPAVGVFSENGFKASNPVNIYPGNAVTLDVLYDDMAVDSTGTAFAEGSQMYYYQLTDPTTTSLSGDLTFYATPISGTGAQADDLQVTIHGGPATIISPVLYQAITGVKPPYFVDVDAVTISLAADALEGARYNIRFGSNFDSNGVTVEYGVFSNDASSIPEFPTVALPVASLLGLLFIFGRKKERL